MYNVVPMNGETWLICGGRDFKDKVMFNSAMSDLMELKGCPNRVVHGAARGADTLANDWAERLALDIISMPADWDKYGRSAGHIRNAAMLIHKPSLVVAFPGGRGTASMVQKARAANVDVAKIEAME